ncbi:ethanolamine ammonia-lyase subunit EutC [Tuwongella immobilis]|uniref:Ethanolamine ammonia-lyase small subunit n=1 Tax=Tuwongella immobilis TaxID=692036 RepID=A0A6C2YNZ3_9BACT|nr:ethanolamine ammonia-lyase subunit EutC [Tuwongella immobilis]VIP03340.1 ethanolamine ammonia-lyase small subunit : Ethanolamine ammonia-lyase light chain OS=Clostridium acetobutylicum GN=NL50_06790 PE=4 SV=1: EutC [Tuwongella immobilis]VTS04052.1 ethanolamine ammonia-lyase small subunit : Ethanolamine ammonia-lyase light chain OS=Clostridium acetobutylicum GN=NL50_06790 PE=4 SV=1: EutC [Tuwongella immobilis]
MSNPPESAANQPEPAASVHSASPMVPNPAHSEGDAALQALQQTVAAVTPARLLVGRVGESYRTQTLLQLRADHAAATDAVHAPLALSESWLREYKFLVVQSRAEDRRRYLLRPDLGRQLSAESQSILRESGHLECDVQLIAGDGLSATAVQNQLPTLFPMVWNQLRDQGLRLGRPILVQHCRVGILNAIGEILRPKVAVLFIGERPGLATAESLSAYLAYSPQPGHTDANRNLISNIHDRGVPVADAAPRILALIRAMLAQRISGPAIKESLPGILPPYSESPE